MSTRTRPQGCCSPRPLAPLPTRRQERLVGVFKALADPTRLELFRLISAQAEAVCACDLIDHFELSQPTISHHLKVLREAGLLTTKKVGVWSFCAPDARAEGLLAEAAGLAQRKATRK